MSAPLPPLTSLRAFEAAARLLSFSKAAGELHVTPAAISHQIKGLEESLGTELFRRGNRSLKLTEAGRRLLPGLSAGFAELAEAVASVRTRGDSGTLTISVTPTFAAKWLMPRLMRFRARHPEIEIRVDATEALVDLRRDDIDLGVRYGLGVYPGLRADLLSSEEIYPVCSPALLRGPRPLKQPGDLKYHTLLHEDWRAADETWPDWTMWLKAAGVTDVDPTRGLKLSHLSFALQAAIDGQGVALTSGLMASDDLAAGRLVRPFALAMPQDFAYYVVTLESEATLPKIAAFRDWLMAEIAHDGKAGDGKSRDATDTAEKELA